MRIFSRLPGAELRKSVLDAIQNLSFSPDDIELVEPTALSETEKNSISAHVKYFPMAAVYGLSLPAFTDMDAFFGAWGKSVSLNPILRTGYLSVSSEIVSILYKSSDLIFQEAKDENRTQCTLIGRPLLSGSVSGEEATGYRIRIVLHYSFLHGQYFKFFFGQLYRFYHERITGVLDSSICPPFPSPFFNQRPGLKSDSQAQNYDAYDLGAFWPSCEQKLGRESEGSVRHSASTRRSCGSKLPELPSGILRAALAITLTLHSGMNKHIYSETVGDRRHLNQMDCSVDTLIEHLLQSTTITAVPWERVIDSSYHGSDQWKIPVSLNIHDAESWPQSDDVPGWIMLDNQLERNAFINIDVVTVPEAVPTIYISFDHGLSKMEDLEAFADHFVHSIEILVESTRLHLSGVKDVFGVLGSRDKLYTLEYGNRNQVPQARIPHVLLHQMFESYARRNPLAPALEFEGSISLSYGELDTLSSNLAMILISRFGIGVESKVPMLFNTSFELIIAIIAVMKAGGAFVPVGLDLPKERLGAILDSIDAKLLLCGNDIASHKMAFFESIPKLEVFKYSSSDNLSRTDYSPPHVTPSHLAYVLFTSGTTGIPNAVGVEHGNVMAFLSSSLGTQMKGEGKRCLLLSPYTFDICIGDIFTMLTSGGLLQLVPREKILSNLPYWLDVTNTTQLSVTPSIGRLLPTEGLPRLTHIIFGGEKLPPDLAVRMSQQQNRVIINGCGPTEATIHIATYTIPKLIGKMNLSHGVPIGYPIGTSILYVLRPSTMQLVARGEVGEICVGGPQVSRGYLHNAELTTRRFSPDIFLGSGRIFRTGDLGRWNRLGQLEILGRMDYQLKFHGHRIEAGEIEQAVRSNCASDSHGIDAVHALVLEIGREQKLVGVLALTQQALNAFGNDVQLSKRPIILDNLHAVRKVLEFARNQCATHLPPSTQPSMWLCLNYMPTSAHGKLDQLFLQEIVLNHLRASAIENGDAVVSQVFRRSDTEAAMVTVLAQVLSRNPDSIDLDVSFVDLGGTSIHAMRFTTALQTYGINLSIVDVLDNQKCISVLAKGSRVDKKNLDGNREKNKLNYNPFSLASDTWESDLAAVSDYKPHDVEDVYSCSALANYWLKLTKQSLGCAMLCQFHQTLGTDLNPDHFSWCWEQLRIREATLRTVFVEDSSSGEEAETSFSAIVLRSGRPSGGGTIEVHTVSDDEELKSFIYGKLFPSHRLEWGCVPIQSWLIFNKANNVWSFAISRHHALHDVRTMDLQHSALDLLYKKGTDALSIIDLNRNQRLSYGAYVASLSTNLKLQQAFWKKYLQDAHCPSWPARSPVPSTFCKDMSTYVYHIGAWQGNIRETARGLGATPGALIRSAMAISVAEGERCEDTLVFEVVEGSAAGEFSSTWGCCSHVKPTRIRVPFVDQSQSNGHLDLQQQSRSRFTKVVQEATQQYISTLAYLGSSWSMSTKVLKDRVEKGNNFVTCILNILDISSGDFRIDMKNDELNQAADSEQGHSLFRGSLVYETVRAIYVPIYLAVQIQKEKVVFICLYDRDVVGDEDVQRFINRQIEVLETLK